ncbi:MAG: RNA polymerase subunit sigma-24 [Chloroflexi bacterium]|nr:MAG: RNA polymerase subunit sigma-24 [Chloroflexota bacterium]
MLGEVFVNGTAAVLSDESELVTRAVVDPAAFVAIYDQYFSRVYNYVRYRVGDAAAADDLTAQIFERTLTNLASYDSDKAPFGGWLFSIARNLVSNYLRAQKRRRWLSLEAVFNRPSDEPVPETAVIHHQTHAELLTAVSNLNERERDLIALKFAVGMTNRHIARLTGLTESNVGVILHRAVRKLRLELVKKECDDE